MTQPPTIDQTDPAQLASMHGSFGHFDLWRKVVLASCRLAIRGAQGDLKLTEAKIDDMAHTHPAYIEYLTTGLHGRMAYEAMIRQQMGV